MGHRVNTVVTKRTIGFKISSDQKDIPEVAETNKQSLLRPVERPQEVVKLETEAVLSRLTVFPSYSVLFREAQSAIFADNGPLPVSTRHYIAWMVSLFISLLILSNIYLNIILIRVPGLLAAALLPLWSSHSSWLAAAPRTGCPPPLHPPPQSRLSW